MTSFVASRGVGLRPGVSFRLRLVLCLLVSFLSPGINTLTAYNIDGTLTDWGVDPLRDFWPDSPTANYIITDGQNTYNADGYNPDHYDIQALYFDDDASFFYFAVVTKFPFAAFPASGPPTAYTGAWSGGDLGLDFDISPEGRENTDVGMSITEHGRVVMLGPPGSSQLGLDYGVRIGSTERGPLGQVIAQPSWEKSSIYYHEDEGWQGGP